LRQLMPQSALPEVSGGRARTMAGRSAGRRGAVLWPPAGMCLRSRLSVSVCGSFLEEPAHWRLLTTHQVNDIADARRIIGFYRLRWMIEQLFRTTKTKGFDIEALRQQQGRPLEKLVAATIIAAVTAMQLVAERDGKLQRPLGDAFDPGNQPVLERVGQSLEGKTEKQKNPHPKGSLAYASWVFARLGGWTGYYGKPGPIVMLRGLTQFHAIKHGWSLRDV
jgi:hypothetical protein